MAKQQINQAQQLQATIHLKPAGNTTVTTSATAHNMGSTNFSIGNGLTRSGNTIVVGAGVSYILVGFTAIGSGGTSGAYFFTILKKNGIDVSQSIKAFTSGGFASNEATIPIPVTNGDVISITSEVSTSTATLDSGRPQNLWAMAIG